VQANTCDKAVMANIKKSKRAQGLEGMGLSGDKEVTRRGKDCKERDKAILRASRERGRMERRSREHRKHKGGKMLKETKDPREHAIRAHHREGTHSWESSLVIKRRERSNLGTSYSTMQRSLRYRSIS
jgi:hypothetical protein